MVYKEFGLHDFITNVDLKLLHFYHLIVLRVQGEVSMVWYKNGMWVKIGRNGKVWSFFIHGIEIIPLLS